MFAFARFMNTVTGRWTRVVGGIAMIMAGLALVGGLPGIFLAAAGLVPLLAGTFDVCVLAPVIHTPFSGNKVRAILDARDRSAAAAMEQS